MLKRLSAEGMFKQNKMQHQQELGNKSWLLKAINIFIMHRIFKSHLGMMDIIFQILGSHVLVSISVPDSVPGRAIS
jgi:hypothetical protein